MEFDVVNLINLALQGSIAIFVYWFLDVPVVNELLKQFGAWVEANLNLSSRAVKYVTGALVSVGGCLVLRAVLVALAEAAWPTTPVDWINMIGNYALVWLAANTAHAMTYPKS